MKAALSRLTLAVSLSGLALIASFEGRELEAYPDAVGVPTICYGHTANVILGTTASPEQCMSYLRDDASTASRAVNRLVAVPLTQNQHDALVSLVFNIGEGAFARSTLLRVLNAGDCRAAGAQFNRWVRAKGKILKGLVTRRKAESDLFLTGCSA